MTVISVSYTHLDVYKRQILNAIDNVASLAAVKECHSNDVGSIFFCREADSSASEDEIPDATVNMDSYDQGYASTIRMFEYMKDDGIEPFSYTHLLSRRMQLLIMKMVPRPHGIRFRISMKSRM